MNQFRAWAVCVTIAAGTVSTLLAAKGDPAKGKQVFERCGMCHNADSEEKKMGPGLKGLFKHDKLADGKKATEANIRAKIDDGGNGMPGFKDSLDDQEKEDLIAYLKTL
jgi:cytochrome c